MGIRERKKRDERRMREGILTAAMALFTKGGAGNVTMRRIAARIEYSPGAIYRYFSNKNELLMALCRQGFEMLLADMPSVGEGDDPYQVLRSVCRGYLQFAHRHPDYYELMFSTTEIIVPDQPDLEAAPMLSYLRFKEIVARCMERKLLEGDSPEAVTVSLWSSMHGLASLMVKRQFRFLPQAERKAIVAGAFEFTLRRHGFKGHRTESGEDDAGDAVSREG